MIYFLGKFQFQMFLPDTHWGRSSQGILAVTKLNLVFELGTHHHQQLRCSYFFFKNVHTTLMGLFSCVFVSSFSKVGICLRNTLQFDLSKTGAKHEIIALLCTCVLICFRCVQHFGTPWTVAHHSLLSMGFPRQEYWSGLPCPPPGDLLNPGIEPVAPSLQVDSLLPSHEGKSLPQYYWQLKRKSFPVKSNMESW